MQRVGAKQGNLGFTFPLYGLFTSLLLLRAKPVRLDELRWPYSEFSERPLLKKKKKNVVGKDLNGSSRAGSRWKRPALYFCRTARAGRYYTIRFCSIRYYHTFGGYSRAVFCPLWSTLENLAAALGFICQCTSVELC